MTGISSLEICASDSGQALGLEQAGFEDEELVKIERHYCNTLELNRPEWQVFEKDLRDFVDHDAGSFKGIDLLAGGLPCPPFSIAGKQLGDRDEPGQGHEARDGRAAHYPCFGIPLSASPQGSSGKAGLGLPKPPEGDLRARLFLAPARSSWVSDHSPSEV